MHDNNYSHSEVYDLSVTSLNAFMVKVFGWLFFGLMLTAATSFIFINSIASGADAAISLASNSAFYFGLLIAQLILVFALSRSIQRIGAFTAKLMYSVYAILNGITISFIIMMYIGMGSGHAVTQAFLMASVFFGVMCIYGYFTKADLTSLGRILMMGLIAIIITMVINVFLGSSSMDFIISIIGLAIFIGLTAYDVQKIKNHYYHYAANSGEEMASKTAIFGALTLYLDFINMFLFILRILGRRR